METVFFFLLGEEFLVTEVLLFLDRFFIVFCLLATDRFDTELLERDLFTIPLLEDDLLTLLLRFTSLETELFFFEIPREVFLLLAELVFLFTASLRLVLLAISPELDREVTLFLLRLSALFTAVFLRLGL